MLKLLRLLALCLSPLTFLAPLAAQTLPAGVRRRALGRGHDGVRAAQRAQGAVRARRLEAAVTVNLTVFVGSRHENYGEKGMAHLFEHMLFKKTKKFASIKDELTKRRRANGTTWYDRTNYFESFPAGRREGAAGPGAGGRAAAQRHRVEGRAGHRDDGGAQRAGDGREPAGRVLEQRVVSSAFEWHNYGTTPSARAATSRTCPTSGCWTCTGRTTSRTTPC